jgi:aminoglycoside phosphotransferase (APT) family kinase protein
MTGARRLGEVSAVAIQRALDRFDLGTLEGIEPVPGGHFGQNVFLTTATGACVLRGNPFREGQFRTEGFFARLIAEHTSLTTPLPWPHDPSQDIFGWEYVLAPRLPGVVSHDPAMPVDRDRESEIAFAQGVALAELQRDTFPEPALLGTGFDRLIPMPNGYRAWAMHLVDALRDRTPDLDDGDLRRIAGIAEEADEERQRAFRPVICHADFHNANLALERIDGRWSVTGIIDLTSCHIGHPESDLARQWRMYAGWNPGLATAFLDGYRSHRTLERGWQTRLMFFVMYDCLKYWGFGKRRGDATWDPEWSFTDYLDAHLRYLAT